MADLITPLKTWLSQLDTEDLFDMLDAQTIRPVDIVADVLIDGESYACPRFWVAQELENRGLIEVEDEEVREFRDGMYIGVQSQSWCDRLIRRARRYSLIAYGAAFGLRAGMTELAQRSWVADNMTYYLYRISRMVGVPQEYLDYAQEEILQYVSAARNFKTRGTH